MNERIQVVNQEIDWARNVLKPWLMSQSIGYFDKNPHVWQKYDTAVNQITKKAIETIKIENEK